MPLLKYDENGFALESGWELCHCCDCLTGAYIGRLEQYVSINCGIPSHAYLDAPPEFGDGEWPSRSGRNEQWEILPDLRGKTAYNKKTKQPREIMELGPLQEQETLLVPLSPYDKWVVDRWQQDHEAEDAAALEIANSTKKVLLEEATHKISVLGDAIDLGMATEDEQAAYNAWRRYRIELTRLDLTITPIVWPDKPA